MEDNYISTYKDEVEDITTIKMSGSLHYSEVSSEFFMNMNLCRIITSDADSLSFQIVSNAWGLRRLVFRLNDSKVISLECKETDRTRLPGPLSHCIPFRLTIEQFRDICSANKVIYKVCDSDGDNFFFGKSEWDMLLEYCRVFYTQAYELNTFPTASSDYEKKINNIVNPMSERLFPKIGSKLDMIPDVLRDVIDGGDDFNGVEVERFIERLIEKLKTSIESSKNKSTKSDTKRPESTTKRPKSTTKRPKSTTSEKMDNHIVVKKVWVDTDGVGQLFVHCDWLANNMKGDSLEFRVNLKAKSGKKVKFDASVNQWYYLLEKFRPQNDSHQFKNTCCAIPQADFNMGHNEKKKLEFNIEVYKWGTNERVYSSKKMAFTVWFYFNFFSKNKFEVRSQQCEL